MCFVRTNGTIVSVFYSPDLVFSFLAVADAVVRTPRTVEPFLSSISYGTDRSVTMATDCRMIEHCFRMVSPVCVRGLPIALWVYEVRLVEQFRDYNTDR